MVAVRDLLGRFRPAGAPGAATVAGVPADRVASVTAELVPVFLALEGVRAECRRIRDDAVEYAARLTAGAEERAGALIARARAEAESDRAAAATDLRASAAADLHALHERAENEADAVRRRATRTRATAVDRVVHLVRRELVTLSTADGRPDLGGAGPT